MSICGELPDLFVQNDYDEVRKFLLDMPDVWFEVRNGTHFWFAASEKAAHMTKLIANQKVKSAGSKMRKTSRPTFSKIMRNKQKQLTSDRNCFFKDNYEFHWKNQQLPTRRPVPGPPTQKRPLSSGSSVETASSNSNSNNSFETLYSDGVNAKHRNGYFYEYQLIGDDHFMTLASAELQCKSEFKRGKFGKNTVSANFKWVVDQVFYILFFLHSNQR